VLAAALNGIAVLRVYFRIFTGTRHVATISLAARPTERFVAITMSVLVLSVGLWPGIAVRSRYHAAQTLLKLRQATGIDHGKDEVNPPGHSALDDLLQIENNAAEGH